MGGIEKLVDFLLSWIRVLRFWTILDENERGVVLRFGRYHRLDPEKWWPFGPTNWPFVSKFTRLFNLATWTNGYYLTPGLHIKFFAWDKEHTVTQATETSNIRVQSLETPNEVKVQASGVFKYEITDPFKYFFLIGDEENFLDDLAYGAMADEILANNWPFDIPEMKKRILQSIRKEAREYGFRIKSFKFENLTRANTLRLFNE